MNSNRLLHKAILRNLQLATRNPLLGLKESGVFDHIRRAEVEALDVEAFTRLTEDIGQGPKFFVDFFVEAYRLIRPESFLGVPVSGTPP